LEIDNGSIDINTIPRQHLTSVDGMGGPEAQLLPAHLKCGMWASLALATVFVAGAKFYFDHQVSSMKTDCGTTERKKLMKTVGNT
jgi:hypothetical protein